MTPEQRKLHEGLRHFDFYKVDDHYTFKTYGGPFLSFEYARQFYTIEEAVEHAKIIVTTCGGDWGHSKNLDTSAWVLYNIDSGGCTVPCVCDPDLYKAFITEYGVQKELSPVFKEVFKGLLRSDSR